MSDTIAGIVYMKFILAAALTTAAIHSQTHAYKNEISTLNIFASYFNLIHTE